jgi:Ca-activated chloride channel family protein
VDITIREQVARVHIDQVFRNLNSREVEGEYLFPVPDGAAVSDFVLYVDGKPVHAQAMDATEALKIYQDLVRQSKDPALLEYVGREMFRARIFPFPPGGDRRVLLDYDHLVERQGGLYRFVYPLSTEKFSSKPLESAYVRIELEADRPIRNAYCPSHSVDIEYLGTDRLRVTWEESGTKPDRDLVLYYSLAEDAMDIRLVSYRPDGTEDGYFMLLASMGQDDQVRVAPKDAIFVIDHSGSMDGEKIIQARDALVYCLEHLNPEDRFNVVSFASSVDAFAYGLQEATRDQVREAVDFVRSLRAGGGTNISGALERVFDARFSSKRPAFVVFITDGLPTEGERDIRKILAMVDRQNRQSDARGVRVFPFGVGYDVNAVFLDQLAEENAAFPSYVRPTEDLQSRIETFYSQVANPVMVDLEIHASGPRIRGLQPSRIPDIFRGGQLVLFGRYQGAGSVEITLSGLVEGEKRTFNVSATLPRKEERNTFVGRLWATRRVGALLRQVRLHGEEPELVEEIKDLGLSFAIATPYTSFLVDERARVRTDVMVDADAGWGVAGSHQRMSGSPVAPTGKGSPQALRTMDLLASGNAAPLRMATGRGAFEMSKKVAEFALAESEEKLSRGFGVRMVAGRAFQREGEIWKEVDCPENAAVTEITVGSEDYFDLLLAHPELGAILALGESVVFRVAGEWYKTVPAA